jgi:hypothetical protein
MSVLVDPRKERYAQELAKPNRPKLDECFAVAGFTGGNSSRMARRPEIAERVREIQSAAANLAELDSAWLLLRAKRIAEFDTDKLLTGQADLSDLPGDIEIIESDDEGESAEPKSVSGRKLFKMKVKASDRIAAFTLIAKVLEFIRPGDVNVNVSAVAAQINGAMTPQQAAEAYAATLHGAA